MILAIFLIYIVFCFCFVMFGVGVVNVNILEEKIVFIDYMWLEMGFGKFCYLRGVFFYFNFCFDYVVFFLVVFFLGWFVIYCIDVFFIVVIW